MAHSKKSLRELYGVSKKTWAKWEGTVPELGKYSGGAYTSKQLRQIVEHLGPPPKKDSTIDALNKAG